MLQQLRDSAKTWVSSALLILLVLSFGIWGIGDIFRSTTSRDWIAKVGGTKIPPEVLQHEFNNEVGQIRAMLGASFTKEKAKELGLVERSLNTLVTGVALNLETQKLGLNVSRAQIIRTLESTPQLRNKDGSFNRGMFEQLLRMQGLNEANFIEKQKEIVARNMLVRGMAAPLVVPDAELKDVASAMAQKRVAELVQINTQDFPAPAPTADELKAFYDDNKNSFMAPERRTFKALFLSPKDLTAGIKISDDDVKKEYEANKAQFGEPEKRDLVQVVTSDEEKANALAAAAAKGNLEQAAKDAGLEAVKLDKTTAKDMPAELADAVFKAKLHAVEGPVKTALGYHVFVVNAIAPGKTVGFEEARKTITEKLQTDKAADTMVQTANKVDDMLAGGKKLDDIASTLNLKTISFEGIDAAGHDASGKAVPAMPYASDVMRAAFQYAEGEASPLIESKEGGYVVVEIAKVVPTHAEELAAVKDKVTAAWQNANKGKKALEAAQTITSQLKEGKALSEITGTGVKKSTSAAITFDDQNQKDVPREALDPLFTMKKGEASLVHVAGGELVVRVKEILSGDDKAVTARMEKLKEPMLRQFSQMNMEELTHALRDMYPVEVDQKAIARMFTDNTN